MIGTVVGQVKDKTVKVAVVRLFRHPVYGKTMRRTHTFLCHVTDMDVSDGEKVKIVETKPMSKNKHFRVVEKIKL